MKKAQILQKVKRDYTAIAREFDVTRDHAWPEFEEFHRAASGERKEGTVLDVGCGNGRLFEFLKKGTTASYTGIDNNKKLLAIARKKYPQARFMYGDILALPFPDQSFDSVWCIAVLHHIPTKTLQKKAAKELRRVLKKGGQLMLTAWNLWQPKYLPYINKKTHDAFIPWNDSRVQRYYHAFKSTEVRSLLRETGFKKIIKIKSAHNFAFIAI